MKKITWLLAILAMVIGGGWILYKNLNHTSAIGTKDFAIEHPETIDKIYLSPNNGNGKYLILTKTETGNWFVENGSEKCEADSAYINIILYTLMSRVEVKNPVAESAIKSISHDLSTKGVKAEFYRKGQKYKTMYIGYPTGNYLGTYAYMEQHDRPVILSVPNFEGFITPYFTSGIDDFRSPVLMHCPYAALKKLEITWPGLQNASFSLEKDGENVVLKDQNGKEMRKNTNTLRSFAKRFENIGRVSGLPAQINKFAGQRDSVLNGPVFCKISVEKTDGSKQQITLYPKKVSGETYSMDDPAKPGQLKTFETDSYWITGYQAKVLYEIQELPMRNRLWKLPQLME